MGEQKINRIYAVYYSAVGSTQKAVVTLASHLSELFKVSVETIDFTKPAARELHYTFEPADLVVFGSPTYAGKLPNKMLPFIKSGFTGNGAAAAALVTFGNRSFDNSLAELNSCLTANGFRVIAGAAMVAQHAFSQVLAAGRPDAADLDQLIGFGNRIYEKLIQDDISTVSVPGNADAPYYRPLGLDGQPKVFLKAKPVVDEELCDRCGLCVSLCPMGSIDPADPLRTPGLCIKCYACVRRCPKGARSFTDEAFLSHKAMLERDYTERKEPSFYL